MTQEADFRGGSTAIARSAQQSAQDTIRWGDRVAVTWGAGGQSSAQLTAALQQALARRGKQITDMHWRWPCAFQLALVLTPQFAVNETGLLTVTYQITFGAGNNMTFTRNVTIPASAASVYVSAIDTGLVLPAQHIQITPVAIATGGEGSQIIAAGSVEIGAFVAPQTEVHAITEMLACLCRLEGANGGVDQRVNDWMEGGHPPGFHPEPLGYRR